MSDLLQGRRLLLRPLAEADAEALFAAVEGSREALKRRLRWVAGVSSPADALDFARAAALAGRRGAAEVFVVVEARSGALAGVAALQSLQAVPGLAELSLWIRSDRQDRGYAVEAGRLLIAHAFRHAGRKEIRPAGACGTSDTAGDVLQKLYARIDPANRAARKVLQRTGFRYEGCLRHEKRLNGRWIDQECWGLLRGEWRK